MGYEIIFSFHERLEEGGYNKDETKELKKKVGDAYEDVPLEKVASIIMGQLVRRDIWVVNFDVFEYKKQKINGRETKGGIVLKNKKFTLDNEANLKIEDEGEPVPTPVANTQLVPRPQAMPLARRPMKWVVVDMDIMHKIEQLKLKFSPDKKYPVYAEMDDPRDTRKDRFGQPVIDKKRNYILLDDLNKEVTVAQEFFLAADAKLIGDAELGFSKKVERNDGMVDRTVYNESNMVNIR